MNVVIVGGSLPYPPTAGNRIRTLNLTLRLAARHRITYVYHRGGDPEESRSAAAYLREHGVETLGVDHEVPPKSGPAFYARLAANLASPLPYSVATHIGPEMRRAVRSLAETRAVDLWQAEGAPYFEALRGLAGARKLLMAHNVESQIWERYHETEGRRLRKWYIARQWRKFERFERQACAEATRVVVVSDEDAALVRGRFGAERVDVVDNGVDRAYFGSVEPAREDDRILFLGGFDWRPNLDAVDQLLDGVFPAVRAVVPSAKLDLVGRNPPESLARRARDMPNVTLHPDVPDVRPFLARSGVMAVPLRIGGGSRLKILEALATGLPVVSTRVGAEGLRLTAGHDLAVVERVEEMAAALVGCLRDPGAARAMAACGRRLVLERYDWGVLADKLGRIWEGCLHGAVPPAGPEA
ncbi:MAG: glycosyltransferase [Singulisphaera sp.]